MATIYKGTSLAEGPAVSSWKIGVGGQTKRTFEGKQTDIVNKALELQYAGYETEITSGPKWTLVATINIDLATNPGGGNTEPEPVPTWELVPHTLEQSIYESQRPFVSGLPSDVKASIETKLKNPQNKTVFVVPIKYSNPTIIDNAFRVYTMKQMNIDSRRFYTLSLKRSIVVSTAYNLNWSINNANTVLSTPRVSSQYGVPNVLQTLMPPSSYQNETVPVDDPSVVQKTVVIPFFWGWLEQHPAYQYVATNRIQVSQEWIYGKWTCGSYGLYDVIN